MLLFHFDKITFKVILDIVNMANLLKSQQQNDKKCNLEVQSC